MRRIKLVLAAVVVMVAVFAAFAGPAMAADRDDNWNWNNNNYWNNYSNNGYICFDNGTASGCLNVGGYY